MVLWSNFVFHSSWILALTLHAMEEQLNSCPPGTDRLAGPTPPQSRQSSIHIPRKTSWGTPIPPPSSHQRPHSNSEEKFFDVVDINGNCDGSVASDGGETWNTLENIASLGLSFAAEDFQVSVTPKQGRFPLEDEDGHPEPPDCQVPAPEPPFNKWLKNLKKGSGRRKTVSCDIDGSALEREREFFFNHSLGTSDSAGNSDWARARKNETFGHKKSSSGSSSFGFVTAMKSASISLASFSVAPRSRRTGISSHHNRADRSSKTSYVARLSEDGSFIDQAVTNRLLQRRRILEEIIGTEEGYVADIRFLMNVYVTLLASMPTLSLNLRISINRNLNEIVGLHDEILGELHRVVPHSEYTQKDFTEPTRPPYGHHRWRSLDAVPEHIGGGPSWLQKIPGMTAEPKVAAAVARVFGKKVRTPRPH